MYIIIGIFLLDYNNGNSWVGEVGRREEFEAGRYRIFVFRIDAIPIRMIRVAFVCVVSYVICLMRFKDIITILLQRLTLYLVRWTEENQKRKECVA